MSLKLTPSEILEIQIRYDYLINYESDDPTDPFDPLRYKDSNGDHLLHIAAQLGDLKTVELLIRAGIDVDQLGDMGCTALHYSRMNGQEGVTQYLIAHGAAETTRNAFGKLPGE